MAAFSINSKYRSRLMPAVQRRFLMMNTGMALYSVNAVIAALPVHFYKELWPVHGSDFDAVDESSPMVGASPIRERPVNA